MDNETTVNGVRYKLKQCEVMYLEDEFGHSYFIDDEPVAGVTTLLGMGVPIEQGLLDYFKRTDKEAQEDILTDAQERGSNVHHAIERLLHGESVESMLLRRKREKLGVAAFVNFFLTTKPEDIVSEQVVAYIDDLMRFAGTLDFIGTFNGRRILIDFKTSEIHSKKNELQVKAYQRAVEQSSDEKIDDCYVLYVGTKHKGSRATIDTNGLPSNGPGWSLVKANATFEDFSRAYDTAMFMNNNVYPTPPKVITFPEQWHLIEQLRKDT